MADLTAPLDSKRRERGKLVQQVQHGLPAFVLLFNGLRRVGEDHHGWALVLALAEITAGLLVIAAFWRQLRGLRRGPGPAPAEHHGVDRIDLLLGLMLTVEVWAHWYETGHVRRPTLLLAATMVTLGLLHSRLVARAQRVVRVDDGGLSIGLRFFRRFDAAWIDLASIDVSGRYARITRTNGSSCSIDLDDLKNSSEVRAVLARAQERLGAAIAEARATAAVRPAVSGP